MAFGLSFGKKKQTMDTTTNLSRTESGTQSGTSNQNQTTSQLSNTNTTGSSLTQTRNDSAAYGTSDTVGSSTAQQQQVTQNFSDATLGGLESLVSQMLNPATAGRVVDTSNFDPAAFVRNGMAAAQARAQTGLDEATGGLVDTVGGRENSAVAMLQQRLMNDSNAALAGIESQLTGQAEEIRRNNMLAANSMAGTQNDLLTNLLGVLRGGISSTTGTTAEQTRQNQQTQNVGSETGTQAQDTQQNTNTQAVEQMTSVLSQLLSSLTNVTGTERTQGSTKSGGFGFGLSL